ncbi:MAG TPA: DinB family protein [Gemmatimonadales bacterium]|nr:DinB family protein [Gemmatimonadales bacterium]
MLERLFAHLRWADGRTLAALRAAPAPPAKALELYAHILGAEHLWLARLRQEPAKVAVWPAADLAGCDALAAANHSAFSALGATLDEAELNREIPYTNSAGKAFHSRVRDILLHVVLHGCYHRGQVALLLREAGAEPEPTDYIAFVRGAAAATRQP